MERRLFLGAVLLLIVVLASNAGAIKPTLPEKSVATEKQESARTAAATSKDVLIINDPRKHAYFGWYKASQMPPTGWMLLNRTIEWATNYKLPNETRIVFFRNMPPDNDSATVYDWLIAAGYDELLIDVENHSESEGFPPGYYGNFDLVIYWNTTGYDSTNIVDSGIPFLTVSAAQTNEMGIGTGVVTSQNNSDTFYVVNNNYYPTYNFPLGAFSFESTMEFEATEAAGTGKALAQADEEGVDFQFGMSLMEDVTVSPSGNATLAFTVMVPDYPLGDMYRDWFFTGGSSLEPGVEYEVPVTKPLQTSLELEDDVKDVSLPGDIDGDGKTDMRDIGLIARAFGSFLGDEGWVIGADIEWDGRIDMRDIGLAARNFGKTRGNTGNLNVVGYFNGTAVNCSNVYYLGPHGASPAVNTSGCGYTWRGLYPGQYTVYGTGNLTTASTTVDVAAQETTYAQLDLGGANRPPPTILEVPVRDEFHLGVMIEQLLLLGFSVGVTESKIMQFPTGNVTRITLVAQSPQLAEFISHWRIPVGPRTDNATSDAADFTFTKIQKIQQLLRMFPKNQAYRSEWQITINLPPEATLLNANELIGLNWTVDYGGGTYLQANVTVDTTFLRVYVNEVMVVTEQNINASETYLAQAFVPYKVFNVDYAHSGFLREAGQTQKCPAGLDWSKRFVLPISLGPFEKTWTSGDLEAYIRIHPRLHFEWKFGWKFEWGGIWDPLDFELKKVYTWVEVEPSIEGFGYVNCTYSHNKPFSHTVFTYNIHRWYFAVDFVPVWATLRLTGEARMNVDVNGKLYLEVQARAFAGFRAGVQWTSSGGWEPIWRPRAGGSVSFPRAPGIYADFTLTPSIACRLALLVYDSAGPFLEGEAYSLIRFVWEPASLTVKLNFRINAGITFAGWLKSLLGLRDYSTELGDWELASWEG